MKTHFLSSRILYLFVIATFLSSCEKVIELDLDTQEKELVVDGAIDWEKGTQGREQKIHLYFTQPYYEQGQAEYATGASVSVTDNQGNTFLFPETQPGNYLCSNFTPELGKQYELSILHQGKQYRASDLMREVPLLSEANIEQRNDGGFTRDEIQLTLRFDANPTEENNFILKIKASSDGVSRIYGFDGRFFTDGHFFTQIVSRSRDKNEKFKPGDTVEISLYRVSENYKDFIRILSNNSSDNAGAFSIPNWVKGNIVNTENFLKNPLGAFRVAQYSKIIYTIR